MSATNDPIARYEKLSDRIEKLAAAPLDTAAILSGQSGRSAQLADMRALLATWQPAYDAAIAERDHIAAERARVAREEAQEAQATETALKGNDMQLAQLDVEEQHALARFALWRAELMKMRRRITGDMLPEDTPMNAARSGSLADNQMQAAMIDYRESKRRTREVVQNSPEYLELYLHCESLVKAFRGWGVSEEQIDAL